MKHKRLAILVVIIVILIVGSVAYSNRHRFFPSQQMKALRQLEARLDLPKPKYRDVQDVGYYTDWKGAHHYDRHIALSYEDASVLNILRTELLKDSWKEQPVDTLGSLSHFSFTKGTGNAKQCVGGFTSPKGSDGVTLYISLHALGEYSCPAPDI